MTFTATELSVKKSGRLLLDGLTLSCAPGECLILLGENGAGKSVALRTLAMAEDGASGSIHLMERRYDLTDPHLAPPWPELTLVLQSLALWPHLTAGENIRLPWRSRDRSERLPEAELAQLMTSMEIDAFSDRRPAQLSGGQRQRVAVARALALRPKVLLLDEPSSAMDARQSASLAHALNQLKAQGTIIICVSHNLGFAAKIADQYLFLDAGRCLEAGRWSDLKLAQSPELRAFLDLNSL